MDTHLTIGGELRTRSGTAACPACQQRTGLTLIAQHGSQQVTGQCTSGHTWPVHDLTGDDVRTLYAQNAAR
jgi:hypothetical protein